MVRPPTNRASARDRQKRGPGVVGVERDRPERDRRQREQQHRSGQAPRRGSQTHEQPRQEHQRREPAESHQRLEGGVVVRRAEGGRREEDRQRTGRILHEEIAVGNAPVEDCVGKALVEMNVAKARSAKEPAVGDGAGPDVERDRGSREPQREATAGRRRREPGRSRRNCRFPSSSSSCACVASPSAVRAAGHRVLQFARDPDRRRLRRRETPSGTARSTTARSMRQLPDRGREGRPRDRDAVHREHRDLTFRIADPDRGLEPGHHAGEPCVREVVRRARLAGGGLAEVRPDTGALRHVLFEDAHDLGGNPVGHGPLALRHAPARLRVHLPARQDDLPDRHRRRVDASRRERRVDGGHVHRRDHPRAETHRRHVRAVARA